MAPSPLSNYWRAWPSQHPPSSYAYDINTTVERGLQRHISIKHFINSRKGHLRVSLCWKLSLFILICPLQCFVKSFYFTFSSQSLKHSITAMQHLCDRHKVNMQKKGLKSHTQYKSFKGNCFKRKTMSMQTTLWS